LRKHLTNPKNRRPWGGVKPLVGGVKPLVRDKKTDRLEHDLILFYGVIMFT
jgi:hypothetical protein